MSKLSRDELRALRDKEEGKLKARNIHGRTAHVVVGMGTSGIDSGAKLVLNTIADELEKAGLDNVILTQTGSLAPVKEPVVEVFNPEEGLTVYQDVSVQDAVRIVKEHIAQGKVVAEKRVAEEE